jgi:hypothetical protein
MPWRRCLRPGSRKSRAELVVLLLLLASASVPAQIQHATTVTAEPDHLSVSITVAGAEVDNLFENMQNGMTVRVEYRIRITSPRRPPFRMLGDRLEAQFRPMIEASWDPFRLSYIIRSWDGRELAFQDEAAFYSELFSLVDYPIPWSGLSYSEGVVVETRAEYTPIVLVSGLSILSLFTTNRSLDSTWSEHPIQDPPVHR